MKIARSLVILFGGALFVGVLNGTLPSFACPGASSAIELSAPQNPEERIGLGYCNRAECQAVLEQLEAGKSAIVANGNRWVRIEPLENGQFKAIVRISQAGYPIQTQVFHGTLALGGGMRGGCGSEIQIVS